MEARKDYTFYIKREHGSVIQKNLKITSKCAVPINIKLALNTSDQCHLMKMETKAPKNVEKRKCPGQRITSYENGLLKFIDRSELKNKISMKEREAIYSCFLTDV